MDTFLAGLLFISGILTILCWRGLWRSNEAIGFKVVWGLLAVVPVLGPLIFGVLHDPPSAQPDIDRAAGGDWDVAPGIGRSRPGHDA